MLQKYHTDKIYAKNIVILSLNLMKMLKNLRLLLIIKLNKRSN